MIVVAFYTLNNMYEEEVKGLIESCEKFNIRIVTRGYESRGRWARNCAIKPEFLLDMLEEHNEDVLYLDADARIRKPPVLFMNEFNHDIGIHIMNYHKGSNTREGGLGPISLGGKAITCGKVLSGTIYLKNNERVKNMVRRWIKDQILHPHKWDQKTLKHILSTECGDLNLDICNIPPNYTHMIGPAMANFGDPIIEHMQVSKIFKKLGHRK